MIPKYPMPKWVFVDVDGTLIKEGVLNQRLVDWCKERKQEGFKIVLWSNQGIEHATQAAASANVTDIFDFIISKPGYIVDDKEWSWANFVPALDAWR